MSPCLTDRVNRPLIASFCRDITWVLAQEQLRLTNYSHKPLCGKPQLALGSCISGYFYNCGYISAAEVRHYIWSSLVSFQRTAASPFNSDSRL